MPSVCLFSVYVPQMVRETMRNHDQHGKPGKPSEKKHVESPCFLAGSSMSELGGRVHGIAGQRDQPRSGGHDADAAPQAVAGHDLGSRRGLEKWRICPREIDGTWRNPWEDGKNMRILTGNQWRME